MLARVEVNLPSEPWERKGRMLGHAGDWPDRPAFCDSRSFAFERTAGPDCVLHLSRNSANRKRLPSSPAHWQEKYNEASDVSPPDSIAVNNVRLTCADSTLDVCNR